MRYAVIDESNRGGCIGGVVTKFDTLEDALKYAEYTYWVKSKADKISLWTFQVVAFENEDYFDDYGEYDEIVKDYLEII